MSRVVFGLLLGLALSVSCLAQAAPPPIEAYGKLPALEEVHLSPSGDRVAFIATTNEARRLYVVTTVGQKPLALLEVNDAKVRGVEWAGEDHLLVTLSATVNLGPAFVLRKEELKTVISLNVITGKSFQVFHDHRDKVANVVLGQYGSAQVNGHWYGWFGGVTFGQGDGGAYLNRGGTIIFPDLYRVDLETGEIHLAAHGSPDNDEWLISPTGEVAARSLYIERSGTWQVLTGQDGGRVIAAGRNDFGHVGSLHFGRSADTLMAALPTGQDGDATGAAAIREFSLSSPTENPWPNPGSIEEPLFDPVTHLWIGVTLRNDARETALFSPALQARWAGSKKAFPKNLVHLISWTPDFNRLVVMTDGGDDSGTYWFVDIAAHSADPLGGAYPSVKSEDVGQSVVVNYKAADGMQLEGVLTLPAGKPPKALPLVVLPHGGPEARDYPGFDWWAQAFASQGYAVFQPNFRGSSGFGVEFRNAGFGQWGRKMQTDISDGVAALAAKGTVDPKRACIVGGSYGGYAALAGVTVQQGLYRCAVSVAGIADLTDMLTYDSKRADGPSSAMRYWKTFMGVTGLNSRSELHDVTPAALAARADAPILLIHGKDDTVVPIDQSETMASALRSAGKTVEFVKMDNEDHWLSRETTRVQMLKASVAFVEKYNPAN